jgi:flagellar transcriptional activator FlhD
MGLPVVVRRKIQMYATSPKVSARSQSISLAIHTAPGLTQYREMEMTANDMMAEIRDANLSYLMLAQQMIRADKVTAIFRLGISADIAELIEGMSNSQILKLAGGNMMLARFRFDDTAILSMLTNYNKDRSLAQSHAAILMAGQPVEEIA